MANQFLANTLAGLSQGLLAADSGGWQNFAPGFNQGLMGAQQYQYDKLDREERRRLRELQEQQLQMQVEQQRTANQDAVAQKQAWEKYIGQGMMAPNGMSQAQFGGAPQNQMAPGLMEQFTPEQLSFLKTLPPEQGMGLVAETMFREPEKAKWQIEEVRQGNENVTYRINPQTGEREEIARGAAFAPQSSGATGEFGLAPFYTVGEDGKTYAYQLSKGGGMAPIAIPEGQSVAPQTQYIDTGTAINPMDKRTGGPVAPPMVKDVAGVEQQQVLGTATGEAQVNLPQAISKAESALALIEDIKSDPNRELATGATFFMSKIPGTGAFDFSQKVEQLKGQAFLEAFNSLKGGGQITEKEGAAATQAIARLNQAQTEEGFNQALSDLEAVVKKGLERAYGKAGQSPAAPKEPTQQRRLKFNPATGELE